MESQLRAAIAQHGTHLQRGAGAAVCNEGSDADCVMLLVQGQVLLAKHLQQDDIVTEGQVRVLSAGCVYVCVFVFVCVCDCAHQML